MPADIAFTPHAIERFIERHAPGTSMLEAERHLQEANAVRLRQRTILGQLQYQLEEPRCVLVVKRDPRVRPELVCVTVLPEREDSRGWSEDEEAIRNEWLADQAAARVKRDMARPALLTEASPCSAVAKQPVKPPAPPNVTLPADPEHARIVAQAQAIAIAASLEREREKTKRHEATELHNNVVLKRCLRIVLADLVSRAARGDETALQISELIQQVRPEFLMGDFLRIETEGAEK